MRFFPFVLILVAAVLLWDAVDETLSGEAVAASPSRAGTVHKVYRSDDPEGFQNLMTYQWGAVLLIGGAGIGVLCLFRRMDRNDPFSPTFRGNTALDDLGHSLDQRASSADDREI